jgi:DNA-binding transcriptional MerR regulator
MAKVLDKYNRVIANDSKYTGEEPQWDGCENWDPIKFMKNRNRMFGFYNYYLSAKDLKVFALEWMKKNGYNKDQIKIIKSLRDTQPSVTTSKLCRAMNNGMAPTCDGCMDYYKDKEGYSGAKPHNDYEHVKKEIDSLLSQNTQPIVTIEEDATNEPQKPKTNISPIERLRNKVITTVCRDLDWMLDDWINSETKVYGINLYASLKTNAIPSAGLKYVNEWLIRQRDELNGAIEGDPDSVEGYSYLSKAGIRNRIKELDKMLSQLDKYKATHTNARKPRKKKVQSAEKQVKALKYLSESDEYAVTSATPVRIPGARKVYTFNIKYRKLTVYTCESTEGIVVKGSTLKNFDESQSYSMTLRKPNEVLNAIVTKTEKQSQKIIDELKTKRKPANGRINDQTLILKVV